MSSDEKIGWICCSICGLCLLAAIVFTFLFLGGRQ